MNKKLFAIIFGILLIFGIGVFITLNQNNSENLISLNPEDIGTIKDRAYIDGLRVADSTDEITFGDKLYTKDYKALDRSLRITDELDAVVIDMKLVSPYVVSNLIASEDTKVAEFYLEDFDATRNNLFNDISYFDVKEDYNQLSKEVWFKYGIDYEDCTEECMTLTEWIRFDSLSKIPKGTTKISMWTSTLPHERIEWIPTINGFEILEWAEWDMSTASHAEVLDTKTGVAHDLFLSSDGSKMYTVDTTGDIIRQWVLSTPYNITTALNNYNLSIGAKEALARGIYFSPDGTMMFTSGDTDIVNRWDLTAWDLSTANWVSSADMSTKGPQSAALSFMSFKSDGTILYVGGNTPNIVGEYDMSTAWDLTDTITWVRSFNQSEDNNIQGGYLRADGAKLYLTGYTNKDMYEYNLTTPWNMRTVVHDSTFSLNVWEPTNPTGVWWSSAGTDMYIYGASLNVNQFTIAPAPDNTPPDVIIFSPQNISYFVPISFNVTSIDAGVGMGAGECWVTINSSVNNHTMLNQSTSPTYYNFTAEGLYAAGGYLAQFYCNDSSGNINNSENISFKVSDLTISIVFPNNNTNTTNNLLDVNYSQVSGTSCKYSNDTYLVNTSLTNCGTNITDIIWSEGKHNVTVWASDGMDEVASRISFRVDTIDPVVTITFPATNNSNSSSNTLDIEYTATDNILLSQCWYSNDTYSTNTTLASCSTDITTVIWSEDQHNVTIWANDTAGNIGSDGISFTVHTTFPDINITFPLNNTLSSNNRLNVNFSIFDLVDFSTCWYTNDTESINITLTCGQNITNVLWSEGNHNVTVWVNDTFGNTNLSIVNFTIDSIAPTVNITYPVNFVNYQRINTNLTINYSATNNPANCWGSFDYGKNNITLVCADNNLTVNITSINNNTFTFWANDTAGNQANSSRTWNYKVFQYTVAFAATTMEGSTEPFSLNFTQGGGIQTSTVSLVYNITANPSTFVIISDNVTAVNSLVIPTQDVASRTVPFFWSITMSDGSVINTTVYNQTVNSLEIDDCSTFSTIAYNFTVFDEELQTNLSNTTIEIQLNLFDSGRTTNILNFSQNYSNINPARVCINGSILQSANYSADLVVKYTANYSGNNYAEEYHNILNQTISNSTVPRNIRLYSLKSEDSTEFQVTFRDENLALASNILVYLYRQYVADNDFKVVEVPLTDSNGQTVLHMVRNDVVYNIIFVDAGGNILRIFNRVIAFCQDFTIGQCTLNLNALGVSDTIYDYTDDVGVSYTNPVYSNTTDLVTFDFISTDLSVKTVRTVIVRNNDFGNKTVCTNSLTSTSGTVNCDVSAVVATDRFLFIDIYVDNDLKAQTTIDLQASNTGTFGIVNGALFAFLIMLFFILIFARDKQALIISVLIGWVAVISLGAISGALFGAVSGGIWLIVTAIIFIWKLKKEEVG